MISWRLNLDASLVALLSLMVVFQSAHADDNTKGEQPKSKTTLSPLHTFLGIDPTTDTFERPKAARKRSDSSAVKPNVGDPQALNVDPNTNNDGRVNSGDPDGITTTESAEKLRAALVEAIQSGDQGALGALLSGWQQGSAYERLLETSRQYSLILYLVCLIYPFMIVSSEVLQWFTRHFERGLTDRDRRYHASRMRRRLLLAAVLTGTVALFWWGDIHSFWWNEPQQCALFIGAVIALSLTSAVLRMIIRSAAARYPVLVIRDLYQKQVELQLEVEELRKRLHSFRFAGGI